MTITPWMVAGVSGINACPRLLAGNPITWFRKRPRREAPARPSWHWGGLQGIETALEHSALLAVQLLLSEYGYFVFEVFYPRGDDFVFDFFLHRLG